MKHITQANADKFCRVYDNGGTEVEGGSIDRYTVCYVRPKTKAYRDLPPWQRVWQYVGMNCAPFHPQGFGQHGESSEPQHIDIQPKSWGPVSVGRKCHLGTRILFRQLPVDCRTLVMQDLKEIWK